MFLITDHDIKMRMLRMAFLANKMISHILEISLNYKFMEEICLFLEKLFEYS